MRYSLRVLRKSPGFTLVAVISLALGIGANTAIFTLVHAVLLRPLPYPHPQQLLRADVRMPEYNYWIEHSGAFASTAVDGGTSDRRLSAGSRQDWIKAMSISTGFFRTLGIAPSMGREFESVETSRGGPRTIILTDGLWRRTFDSDPAVLGRTVMLDDTGYTIVGILPRDFWFPDAADAFVPRLPGNAIGDEGLNTEMFARLKPGVSLHQYDAERPALTQAVRRLYPNMFPADYRGLVLTPYQDVLIGDTRTNLLLLFGAVGVLLLIACSNVAALMLARLAGRRKEIALRIALGSSRRRLLVQFLSENLLLTAAGAIAALAVAQALLNFLIASVPFSLPASIPIRLDGPVLAFTVVVAVATAAVFSIAPLIGSTRVDLQEALKSGGRTGGTARQMTRSVLVVAEVALSVTLMVSAGLLIQSLYRMHQQHLGFRPDGLTTFSTPFAPEHRRSSIEQLQYEGQLLDRFHTIPGVRDVAATTKLPLAGWSNVPAQREGHAEDSIGGMEFRYVTPNFFAIMGVPVRDGRGLLDTDSSSAPPVLLVNETLARKWWPGSTPLGDRVVLGRFRGRDYGRPVPREVVGVVADTRTRDLKEPPRPIVYLPLAQAGDAMGSITWILRVDRSAGLASQVRAAVNDIDSRQRVEALRTMDAIVAATTASSRFDAWLFGFLAALALVLTAIGVYGLLSYSVARRASEFGTRMALGARPADVLALVLKQGIVLIAIGLVLGLAGALAVTRSLTSLLYGVRPTDPASFAAVAAALLAVGLLASYIPARRATKVDPLVALRTE